MPDIPLNSGSTRETLPKDYFASVVAKHVDLVYSTARRLVGNSHLAEDVAQGAFVALARKIDRVDPRTIAGWLVNATRLAAKEAMRSQRIRQSNESNAATLHREEIRSTDDATADDLLPLLDEALSSLGEADRSAVVLRFFEGKSFDQVGTAIGSTEEAARKRVVRAVDKMRRFFLQQDVGSLTVALAAQQVTNAPATVSAGAITGGSPTAIQLGKGVLTMMKWTQIKIGLAALLVLAAVTTVGYGIDTLIAPAATQPAVVQTPQATVTPSPAPVAPSLSSELARLQQERIDTLTRAYSLLKEMYSRGLVGDFMDVRKCERELLEARLEAAVTSTARAQVLSEMLANAKDQESLTQSRFKAGLCTDADVAEATADRLHVEILIVKDKMQ